MGEQLKEYLYKSHDPLTVPMDSSKLLCFDWGQCWHLLHLQHLLLLHHFEERLALLPNGIHSPLLIGTSILSTNTVKRTKAARCHPPPPRLQPVPPRLRSLPYILSPQAARPVPFPHHFIIMCLLHKVHAVAVLPSTPVHRYRWRSLIQRQRLKRTVSSSVNCYATVSLLLYKLTKVQPGCKSVQLTWISLRYIPTSNFMCALYLPSWFLWWIGSRNLVSQEIIQAPFWQVR